ncbi:hypothetical protein SAMN02745129_2573 [Ferrimonas marina]|uniref:Uncharacterized protein n=1 Tax=Ferrimonas marina TaxID=299255 RepID=A0A1M5UH62_9GAMM|nr:hypothetical protein SAMN02745129_2573 [Ferrimonas marina]
MSGPGRPIVLTAALLGMTGHSTDRLVHRATAGVLDHCLSELGGQCLHHTADRLQLLMPTATTTLDVAFLLKLNLLSLRRQPQEPRVDAHIGIGLARLDPTALNLNALRPALQLDRDALGLPSSTPLLCRLLNLELSRLQPKQAQALLAQRYSGKTTQQQQAQWVRDRYLLPCSRTSLCKRLERGNATLIGDTMDWLKQEAGNAHA